MEKQTDPSTAEKIKDAARRLFTRQGFSATRTRDIADAAGINLALLNYYFRSKEKLFEIIMQENLLQFLSVIGKVVNDETLSLTEKISQVVEQYISLFKTSPDLPFFIVTEVKRRPDAFAKQMGFRALIRQSHFFRQLNENAPRQVDPFQFMMNILALTAFPFLAGPLFRIINDLDEEAYLQLIEERKKLIPFWIDTLLHADHSTIPNYIAK